MSRSNVKTFLILLIGLVIITPFVSAQETKQSEREAMTKRHGGTEPQSAQSAAADSGSTRFSPLNQIHRGNVTRLRRAWTYHTGELNMGTYITPFWLTTAASKRIRRLSAPWRIDPLMFMDELSLDDSRSK